MKKYGLLLVLIIAVVSGGAAVFVANQYLSAQVAQANTNAASAAPASTVPVARIVIAARDIEVGARITEDSLAFTDWPKATVPRGTFTETESLVGRVAVTRLNAGQPVLGAELASADSGAGLVALLEPGMRAMSIKVDEVVGVGGFVLPNTFVDVIAVIKQGNRSSRAKTILERIKVLAIAQELHTEESKPKLVKTVTLQVSPKEAMTLAQRVNEGPIHLVLRNPTEEIPEPVPDVVEIPVAEAPKAPKAPVRIVPVLKPRIRVFDPSPFNVTVIRGSKPPEKIQFRNVESEERVVE